MRFEPHRDLAPPAVDVIHQRDGGLLLRSPQALGPVDPDLGTWLIHGARHWPDRVLIGERMGPGWREVTYGQAERAARGIAAALRRLGHDQDTPIAVLSGNGVDHALLMFGAYLAGVPIVPISASYSLRSQDHRQLRTIVARVRPPRVFVDDRAAYAAALEAVATVGPVEVVGPEEVAAWAAGAVADLPAVGPDHVAKILFTSGSTGTPKGVLNTHRMLCTNQAMIAAVWPFVERVPPVLVDWLPWHHTFGGNHNLHLVLRNGGTLWIDDGKPIPGFVERSVENNRMKAATIVVNVPAGFRTLLPFLEADASLRTWMFSRLDVVFYAGAALSQDLWVRLQAVARQATGHDVFLTSAWGATETSPLATSVHWPIDRAGVIGLPPPGAEVKLAPVGDRFELRVRGPHVTPGYLREPERTGDAFDAEGFYCTGDAGFLKDPDEPSRGIVFDGRIAEDFKLGTGTWVHAGNLRVDLLAATDGALSDLVVLGADRPFLAVGAWLAPGADPAVVVDRLMAYNEVNPSSSRRIERLRFLEDPPSMDAGEITDKGYVNQRAVWLHRQPVLEALFEHGAPDVIGLVES